MGNARLKAPAICAATGLPAVADDTGLLVDALDGAPGVETAYFAGQGHLRREPGEDARRARRGAGSARRVPHGRHGRVARRDRAAGRRRVRRPDHDRGAGAEGSATTRCSARRRRRAHFAQMGAEAKNAISHRGRAFAPCSASWNDGDDEAPVITSGDLEVGDVRRHEVRCRERMVEAHEGGAVDRSATMGRSPCRAPCGRPPVRRRASDGSRGASARR